MEYCDVCFESIDDDDPSDLCIECQKAHFQCKICGDAFSKDYECEYKGIDKLCEDCAIAMEEEEEDEYDQTNF